MAFEPIAIVGRSCLLPGALNPEAFAEAVLAGRDLISEAPADRWGVPDRLALTDDPSASDDRAWTKRGGYVKEEEQKCTADADCTLVAMHCCSCDYKGQLVGINRNHIPQLAVRRTGVCQSYQCVAQKSDHQSCSAKKAVCREGMCVPDVSGAAPAPKGIGVEPIQEEGADGKAEGGTAP